MRRATLPSVALGLTGAMAAGLLSVGLLARPMHRLPDGLVASDDEEKTLPPARHESHDIGFRPLALGGLGVLLGLAGAMALAGWLYPAAMHDKVLPSPMPGFPAPQLQTSPAADMATFSVEQLRALNGTYWIERDRGVVHIPISEAMRAVARDGIADWPTDARVQR